jgi:hypothetical protein
MRQDSASLPPQPLPHPLVPPAASLTPIFLTPQEFLKVYESLREEILSDELLKECYTAESSAWMREMLDYNVPGGKLNRGMAVLDVLQVIF